MFYKITKLKKIDYTDKKGFVCDNSRKYIPIGSPQDIADVTRSLLKSYQDCDKEYCWCFGLNNKNEIKYVQLVSIGILNTSILHPREIFRAAIYFACHSVILVHNHPSGDSMASDEDYKITKKIKEAGEIIGISLLDHVIIGMEEHTSLKELGVL